MKVKPILKWSVRVILVALLLSILALFIVYWRSTNDCERITAAPNNPMKAILHCEYGVDNLKLQEIEKPVPGDNEILVRVRAASLNAYDVGGLRGPLIVRLILGLRKPRNPRFGIDFAGVVEAVGKDITEFKAGDEVFGAKHGAMAEYVSVADRAVVAKPANVTFEQAAAVPVAGLTALQGVRKGNIQPGQKVLINGASGGVGTFAVQIAKAFGAEVTAVCSTRNLEIARSLGADHVIDYTKEDFTKGMERYDVLFDNVCNHSFSERRRILNPHGICVLAGMGSAGEHPGQLGRIAAVFILPLRSRFTDQKFERYMTKTNKDDLAFLRDLMQSGKVTPVIDRRYKLSEVAEAARYLGEGHARGKVVIKVTE